MVYNNGTRTRGVQETRTSIEATYSKRFTGMYMGCFSFWTRRQAQLCKVRSYCAIISTG